jgi:tripartite-type tricarboxylate transporter receptor subunit TctC
MPGRHPADGASAAGEETDTMKPSRFAALAAFAATIALAQGAAADSVADFYKNHTINIVVGYPPGGGADLWARFFAPHFSKHIPGKPNVIVQNMPGGSGFRAINYVYAVGPQDGTNLILPSVSAPTAKALGAKGVRWDTLKFRWLGNLARDAQACMASGRSGIKSIVEGTKRELIVGSVGESNTTAQHPRLLHNLLGYKLKLITGYNGTAPIRIAMERGEVDVVCSIWASSALGPQRGDIESGSLVPIVQMGTKKAPIFGSAPLVYDLTRDETALKIMRFTFAPAEISRPFAVGPQVPEDRVAALRAAFWAAANSPELRADAEKKKMVIDPMDWKETEAGFRAALDVTPEIVERAKKAIAQ